MYELRTYDCKATVDIDISRQATHKELLKLVDSGVIEQVKKGRSTIYILR